MLRTEFYKLGVFIHRNWVFCLSKNNCRRTPAKADRMHFMLAED